MDIFFTPWETTQHFKIHHMNNNEKHLIVETTVRVALNMPALNLRVRFSLLYTGHNTVSLCDHFFHKIHKARWEY